MVGLPASGKSKITKDIKGSNPDIVIHSSDEIRKELTGSYEDQSMNKKVFELLHQRIKDSLALGKTVIYDATNINKKRRIHAIKQEFKADKYECYYMATPYRMCLMRDESREKAVGKEVIDKMYKELQVPFKDEGWDDISFVYPINTNPISEANKDIFLNNIRKYADNHSDLFDYLSTVDECFKNIYNFAQDSKYHSFSVSRHTFEVFRGVLERDPSSNTLLVAALFHDVGKHFTKSFYNYNGVRKKYASFIGHENVSAQIAVTVMRKLGFNGIDIDHVVKLVQYHMMPLNASQKVEKRLKDWLYAAEYRDLMTLHEADQAGH